MFLNRTLNKTKELISNKIYNAGTAMHKLLRKQNQQTATEHAHMKVFLEGHLA